MAEDTGHMGWANWETWNVNLWLCNEEPLYRQILLPALKTDNPAKWLERMVRERFKDDRGFGDLKESRGDYKRLRLVDWHEIVANNRE